MIANRWVAWQRLVLLVFWHKGSPFQHTTQGKMWMYDVLWFTKLLWIWHTKLCHLNLSITTTKNALFKMHYCSLCHLNIAISMMGKSLLTVFLLTKRAQKSLIFHIFVCGIRLQQAYCCGYNLKLLAKPALKNNRFTHITGNYKLLLYLPFLQNLHKSDAVTTIIIRIASYQDSVQNISIDILALLSLIKMMSQKNSRI